MGTQLVLSFAKRYFFNLSNALNSKHNSQTIRILSPYRNISLFSFVFILTCNYQYKFMAYAGFCVANRIRLFRCPQHIFVL